MSLQSLQSLHHTLSRNAKVLSTRAGGEAEEEAEEEEASMLPKPVRTVVYRDEFVVLCVCVSVCVRACVCV